MNRYQDEKAKTKLDKELARPAPTPAPKAPLHPDDARFDECGQPFRPHDEHPGLPAFTGRRDNCPSCERDAGTQAAVMAARKAAKGNQ
jgi:hypothetical protein